jgi:precorrin-3B methylase
MALTLSFYVGGSRKVHIFDMNGTSKAQTELLEAALDIVRSAAQPFPPVMLPPDVSLTVLVRESDTVESRTLACLDIKVENRKMHASATIGDKPKRMLSTGRVSQVDDCVLLAWKALEAAIGERDFNSDDYPY